MIGTARLDGDPPLAVVAMSGGVDSSVAAALLRDEGYRVLGVSLRLWDSDRRDDRICSDHRDAGRVAAHLGIEHTLLDRREDFDRRVVQPFVRDYASGRTPNPCAACNSDFKLGMLLDWALSRGAAFVATGHYARVRRDGNGWRLFRGADDSRDQSYFLFQLSQRQLALARFPLGDVTKAQVRATARRLGLPVADKAASQDLCFGAPSALVAARGAATGDGEVVGKSGEVLGRHAGIERFTVGQRRGLGVSAGRPLYVGRIDATAHRVVVSPEPPRATGLVARGWSWVGAVGDPEEVLSARIRYRHRGAAARVGVLSQSGSCLVRFLEPVMAVTPGQAVVVYRGDEVVGGGWIESPFGTER